MVNLPCGYNMGIGWQDCGDRLILQQYLEIQKSSESDLNEKHILFQFHTIK